MISACYENQTVLISICYTNCIVYWSKRSPAYNVSPVCVVVALHLSTDIKGLVNNLLGKSDSVEVSTSGYANDHLQLYMQQSHEIII